MTTQCLHPTCRCLLLLMLFADRILSGRVSPFLLTFPTLPPLCRRSHASPPSSEESSPPRSVCMLTPLVSFRVLSILSQTVTGVVSTWLHFLRRGTSGSSGQQDEVGNRDVASWLGCTLSTVAGGRKEQVACSFEPVLVPEVEQTPWYPPTPFCR